MITIIIMVKSMMVVDINKLAEIIKNAIMEDLSREFVSFREELKATIDTFRLSVEDVERRLDIFESKIDGLDSNVVDLSVKFQNAIGYNSKKLDEFSRKLEKSKNDMLSSISALESNVLKRLDELSKSIAGLSNDLNRFNKNAESKLNTIICNYDIIYKELIKLKNELQKLDEKNGNNLMDVQTKLERLIVSVSESLSKLNEFKDRITRIENDFNRRLQEMSNEIGRIKMDLKRVKIRDDYLNEIVAKINEAKKK